MIICIITITGKPYTNFLCFVLCLIIFMVMHINNEPPMIAKKNRDFSEILHKCERAAYLSYKVIVMLIIFITIRYSNICVRKFIFNINPLK